MTKSSQGFGGFAFNPITDSVTPERVAPPQPQVQTQTQEPPAMPQSQRPAPVMAELLKTHGSGTTANIRRAQPLGCTGAGGDAAVAIQIAKRFEELKGGTGESADLYKTGVFLPEKFGAVKAIWISLRGDDGVVLFYTAALPSPEQRNRRMVLNNGRDAVPQSVTSMTGGDQQWVNSIKGAIHKSYEREGVVEDLEHIGTVTLPPIPSNVQDADTLLNAFLDDATQALFTTLVNRAGVNTGGHVAALLTSSAVSATPRMVQSPIVQYDGEIVQASVAVDLTLPIEGEVTPWATIFGYFDFQTVEPTNHGGPGVAPTKDCSQAIFVVTGISSQYGYHPGWMTMALTALMGFERGGAWMSYAFSSKDAARLELTEMALRAGEDSIVFTGDESQVERVQFMSTFCRDSISVEVSVKRDGAYGWVLRSMMTDGGVGSSPLNHDEMDGVINEVAPSNTRYPPILLQRSIGKARMYGAGSEGRGMLPIEPLLTEANIRACLPVAQEGANLYSEFSKPSPAVSAVSALVASLSAIYTNVTFTGPTLRLPMNPAFMDVLSATSSACGLSINFSAPMNIQPRMSGNFVVRQAQRYSSSTINHGGQSSGGASYQW
jgi:hypothetical protein